MRRRKATAALAAFTGLALLGSACAGAPAEEQVDATLLLAPDLLPTPYGAAAIRDGNPPGTRRVYLVRSGSDLFVERSEFREHPEGLARFRQARFDLGGTPLGEPAEGDATWEELQAHASYPRAETTRSEATCTTAAGTFEVWLYDWRQPGAEGKPPTRHRVWFAKDLAGPPVLYEMTADGELVFRMELIEGPADG
jgi:hypothetical protein